MPKFFEKQCNHILSRGPNIGSRCDKQCYDEYCKSHFLIHYCGARVYVPGEPLKYCKNERCGIKPCMQHQKMEMEENMRKDKRTIIENKQ